MATLSDEAKQLLQRVKDDQIQYIKLEICDSYCRSIGKLVQAADLKDYLQKGFMIPTVWTIAINHLNAVFGGDITLKNIKCILDIDTYKKLPSPLCLKTYNNESTKMARIMYYPDNTKFATLDPRRMCKNILSKLNKEFGYNLHSSFEHEWQLFKPSETGELVPCWDDTPFFNHLELLTNGYGPFLVECETTLRSMDVNLESMHLEFAYGQYEWTMKPAMNIKAADNSFVYKQTIKQIARNRGLRAMFATTPQCDKTEFASNGCHFNHDLRDNNGKNVFFDENAKHKLSLTGRYWIGGILKHLKALTVFAVPTINCYRRINNTHNWSPCNGSWSFGNRLCMIRVKVDGNPNSCYIEYRLPCSASNPYYIITSVLLAGMHGIRNKILPKYQPFKFDQGDPNLDERFEKIPQKLQDAMDALKRDKLFCEAFGQFFVNIYCKVKEMEIDFVEEYTNKFGDRNKAEQFIFSKL